jgi:hypothetical protein
MILAGQAPPITAQEDDKAVYEPIAGETVFY